MIKQIHMGVTAMYDLKSAFKSTNFEHELMVHLLGENEPEFDELRYQYRSAEVVRREKSSFSMITYYKVPNELRPIRTRNKVIDDFRAEVMESVNELNVMVVVRNGYLYYVELSEKSGNFPKDLSLLTVYKD